MKKTMLINLALAILISFSVFSGLLEYQPPPKKVPKPKDSFHQAALREFNKLINKPDDFVFESSKLAEYEAEYEYKLDEYNRYIEQRRNYQSYFTKLLFFSSITLQFIFLLFAFLLKPISPSFLVSGIIMSTSSIIYGLYFHTANKLFILSGNLALICFVLAVYYFQNQAKEINNPD